MVKLGFLFPGQGAQRVGMGLDIAEGYEAAARVFRRADEVLGLEISRLCFAGPQEKLDRTEFAQPALLTVCVAMVEVLKEHGIHPHMAAGLSLGEYTALVASGTLLFDEALALVAKRGQLMQRAASEQGGMLAVNGLDAEVVKGICREAGSEVWIANYNCPGQVVISGRKQVVAQAADLARSRGAKAIPLAVSVPSHSPLMKSAADELLPYLRATHWKEPLLPVVSNVNARENRAEDMEDILSRQLCQPVLWEQSIRYMIGKGIGTLIEVGPGNTLGGMVKRIERSAFGGTVHNKPSLQQMIERMKEQ